MPGLFFGFRSNNNHHFYPHFRLFGFIEYVNTTCDNVREFDFNSYHFVRFLHPFTLILLYFVSVSLIRSVLISKKYLAVSMIFHYKCCLLLSANNEYSVNCVCVCVSLTPRASVSSRAYYTSRNL